MFSFSFSVYYKAYFKLMQDIPFSLQQIQKFIYFLKISEVLMVISNTAINFKLKFITE